MNPIMALAEGSTVTTSVTTAITSMVSDVEGAITSVIPIVFPVAGIILIATVTLRLFKKFAKG